MAPPARASIGYASSSGGDTVNVRPVTTRRSHRKSRNGCTECKSRHIRCDERRPSCANCEIAERTCSFPRPKANSQVQKKAQQNHAEQNQQADAVNRLSPGSEGGSQASANGTGNAGTNADSAQTSTPALNLPGSRPGPDPVLEQASNGRLPMQDILPSIADLDISSHQISTPGSPMQIGDVNTTPANCLPGLSNAPGAASSAFFTPQHMIVLRHADIVPEFTTPGRNAVDLAIRHAVHSPYLLDEILAFTAFHLAHVYPGSAAYLRHMATELQNRALAAFTRLTEVVPIDDEATAVPRFFFSCILGRHVLADTLAYYASDFHMFIDRLVECLTLNRGIRAVIPPARVFLYNSEIQPFLRLVLDAQKKIASSGNECEPLRRLMENSDLSETSAKACRHAIEVLQHSFDLCRVLEEDEYAQSVSVFSVAIEVDFVDVLRKHRPEALIILAFFGVLLHRCQSFWAFGNAGAPLIRAIAGHVGCYWQDALAWPIHVLETEHNSLSNSLAPRSDIPTTSSPPRT